MDVSISPKLTSLLKQLRKAYPELTFCSGPLSRWSPSENTIYYSPQDDEGFELMHELSHAILKHNTFESDIELVKIEVSAWDYAQNVVGPIFQIAIDATYIEEALASYRQWLTYTSSCPLCGATGMQRKDLRYYCFGCATSWTTNDARQCAGRRFIETVP